MEQASFPKVIRVDSRFRVSGTSTDFRIQLPQAVAFPQGTVCYVSAVSLPHSWWNVEEGMSDKLYVIETKGSPTQRRCRVLTIPAGNYTSLTLPTAIATALNTGSSLTGMAYAVDYVTSRGCLRIQLATAGAADATARFRLPSEDELVSTSWKSANWVGTADAYSVYDLDTMGDLLRLPSVSAATTIVETGLLDISPIHCLYLHSDLPTFDTIGPKGEADIVQRVPVTTSFGYVLHYIANGASEEFFPLGKLSFQELNFRLTNVHNKVIDLHGGQLSIELTFHDRSGML
jgi:hypothetical protein